MYFTNGNYIMGGNFKIKKAAPMDDRGTVAKKIDLQNPNLFDGFTYNGMIVSVVDDTINNGLYRLEDKSTLTWKKEGSDVNFTASLRDKLMKVSDNNRGAVSNETALASIANPMEGDFALVRSTLTFWAYESGAWVDTHSSTTVDLTNYYTKSETYNKVETNSLVATKQDTLVSGTSIKTINGQSVLGNGNIEITGGGAVDLTNYYAKTETETLLANKVDKVTGKGLSTNDFTDTFKQALELKKVQDISTDSVTKKLIVNYTDATVANLNINDIITDVQVSGATLDATTNVLTLTSTDGGADVTVDLSDFVNSGELTSALSGKADKIHSHTTSDITGLDATLSNLVSDLSNKQSSLISGTNIKTINGQSVLGSGDIIITGGGSGGSSTFTGTAAIDIGGIKVGDSWDNAPISDVVNAIINPELFPTFVNPTFSFTSTVNGFKEVGSITDITFNVNFSRGSITPQYSAENNYRSGLPTTYNYNGPVGSEVKANNTLTDTKTITGYSIAIGNNTFSCSVDYSIGTQPKSSKGNDYNTPLPAGTLAAKSVTITGVYPVYNGIGTLSKIPLQAHGTAIVVDAPADMNVGGNRFTIQYPNVWSAKTPVVQQENELSKAWDNQNMSEYGITDINISGVPYKQVKYTGSGIGVRKLKLVF